MNHMLSSRIINWPISCRKHGYDQIAKFRAFKYKMKKYRFTEILKKKQKKYEYQGRIRKND